LIATGIALAAGAIVLLAALISGGGGDGGDVKGPASDQEVVDALGLSPNPDGAGWITLDGACAVPSIQIGQSAGAAPPTTAAGMGVATNEAGTVRAVVQNAFSQDLAGCIDRISAELRAHF